MVQDTAGTAGKMVLHFDNFSGFSGQATKGAGTTSILPVSAIPGRVC
jgi:hypothetical protein